MTACGAVLVCVCVCVPLLLAERDLGRWHHAALRLDRRVSGETAWSSGGGGCSAYETATAAQLAASTTLYGTRRGTPDVSLDDDPASGVSVYDSTTYQGQSGWRRVGGTSASTPMWAARSADAGAVVNAGYVCNGFRAAAGWTG